MAVYNIIFEPLGRRGQCSGDESLLDCARRLGVGIANICGGQGTCFSCRLQVLHGTVSAPTSNEIEFFSSQELADGWRLACQVYANSDATVSLPPESMTAGQRTQVEGVAVTVPVAPPIGFYHVRLPPPSLSDLQADADRLLAALTQQHQLTCTHFDISILRTLSPRLRSWDWECEVGVRGGEVVALLPWPSRHLGLAIDLGTTKIAGYLVDLDTGHTLAAKAMVNPQVNYGEDIITRLSHVMKAPAEAARMQEMATSAIKQLAVDLCYEVNAETPGIMEAVVVGNTAMHHLWLGLPVAQLACSPFLPAVCQAQDIKARDLGLDFALGAYIHLLPNIAGFVGADHVAMLLATGAWRSEDMVVALDIGTNTEVSLIEGGRISTVSCASGPAFEGGHIKHGMRAASGAIERLRIVNDKIQYQTIDEAPPVGICGSGVLDAMAQLYLAGIIDRSGRMQDGCRGVRTRQQEREFILVGGKGRKGQPVIAVTQRDIRELQLAKAAIRTGIQVLLEANGRSEEEISRVIIAGAFGSYIDISSAVAIGMLPPLPLKRFQQVGNAAGMGAKLALISRSQRSEAQAIAAKINYIELASAPSFMPTFTQATQIG